MHHPRRETGTLPHRSRSLVAGFVDRFHGGSIGVLHALNGTPDQLRGNPLPPKRFENVHSIDNADSTRFENRRNAFLLVYAPDEKTNESVVLIGDVSNAGRIFVSARQPLRHRAFAVWLEPHIRTYCRTAVV